MRTLVRFLKWLLYVVMVSVIIDIVSFYTLRVAINPVCEEILLKFFPPTDMFSPEKCVELVSGKTSYELEYQHNYSGQHEIDICFVRKNSDADSFTLTSPGLIFRGNVSIKSSHAKNIAFAKQIVGTFHYYGCKTNGYPLIRYSEIGGRIFKDTYKVMIEIEGDISKLLDQHAKCFLQVKNDTHP